MNIDKKKLRAQSERGFQVSNAPAVIVALLDEIDRQATQFKEWQASHHTNYCAVADERDQLKAENEALRDRKNSITLLQLQRENLLAACEGAITYVAFAFDQGIEGAEASGLALESAVKAVKP